MDSSASGRTSRYAQNKTMTHKEQILKTLEKEIKVCKRLFTLLPKELYDYKPAEGMHTSLYLQLYLYLRMNNLEVDTDDCRSTPKLSKNKSELALFTIL